MPAMHAPTATHRSRRLRRVSASSDLTRPFWLNSNAGIIAGHARLLAAWKLQPSEVSVVVLDHPDASQVAVDLL
jgi:hypothetical protein